MRRQQNFLQFIVLASMKRAAFLIVTLLVTLRPVFGAKTIDLDAATIADINAASRPVP
jgi:hypothetical protein